MSRSPNKLKIASELVEALHQYANARGYSLSEGLNELIRIGLAASPEDALIDTAKKAAFREVQSYFTKRLTAALNEVTDDVSATFGFKPLVRTDRGTG